MKPLLICILIFFCWMGLIRCGMYLNENEPSAEVGAYVLDKVDNYKANVDSIRNEKATR